MACGRRHYGKVNRGGVCSFLLVIFLDAECLLKELDMRKFISTLFLAVGLFVFAIKASGTKTPIYYETTQVLQTERHKIITSKHEKFRMTVSNDIVNFGINGFTG